MVSMLTRLIARLRPYQPMIRSREHLDGQYKNGTWDYLWSIGELARFSVVAGYCRFLRPGGAILEVGCGEGVLQDRLDRSMYRRYVGVDLSEEAIAKARTRIAQTPNSSASFVVADALGYAPSEQFDVIIFNESLEYFADPGSVVQRYEPFLTPNGLFIASVFRGEDGVRWQQIWRQLARKYDTHDATTVTNARGLTWDIRALALRAKP